MDLKIRTKFSVIGSMIFKFVLKSCVIGSMIHKFYIKSNVIQLYGKTYKFEFIIDLNGFSCIFFVKNTKIQIRGKIFGFVNTNPKNLRICIFYLDLYILHEFLNQSKYINQ